MQLILRALKVAALSTSVWARREEYTVPLNPETAENYEIGVRSSWLDNRLIANITAYIGGLYRICRYHNLLVLNFYKPMQVKPMRKG